MKIAVSHPGKIGDLLFALPVVRDLAARHGARVDLFTSPYCRAALPIVAAQPYIGKAEVLEDYVMEHFLWGAQPWQMPVPDGYDVVHHLGFRAFPDRHTVRYTAAQVGLPEPDPDSFSLDVPDTGVVTRLGLQPPFVIITGLSTTGGGSLTWDWSNPKVSGFVSACPHPVYAVGLEAEWARYDCAGRFTGLPGLTLLEIADVMRHAAAVITYSTGLGVLASGALAGTDVPLVCLFDGEIDWDIFRLPGALTCSPDEDLAAIAMGTRTTRALAEAAAAGERDRRATRRRIEELTSAHRPQEDTPTREAGFAQLAADLDRLRREADALHEELHARNLEAALLHQDLHAARTRLARVDASRVWRWTRPLRALLGDPD